MTTNTETLRVYEYANTGGHGRHLYTAEYRGSSFYREYHDSGTPYGESFYELAGVWDVPGAYTTEDGNVMVPVPDGYNHPAAGGWWMWDSLALDAKNKVYRPKGAKKVRCLKED